MRDINYIARDDLCISKAKELESVFIEIINSKGKNTIVGCVYQYPCMNPTECIEDLIIPPKVLKRGQNYNDNGRFQYRFIKI